MKRLLSLAGFVAILSLIPLTSAWAVWEGNAGIGQASDFPGSGLYAKSDMFPKNTVVEIKNLETEKSVRAVITGSSGIPGLVAVLSPETASALSIKAGSVCRVRIFIPSITERPADGTIVDGTKQTNADPDANPAAAVNQPANPDVPLESIAESPKDPLVALAPEEAVVETAPVPAASEAVAPAETASSARSSVSEVSPANESSVAEAPATPAETAPVVASTAEETAPAAAVAVVPLVDQAAVEEPVSAAEPAEDESAVAAAEPETSSSAPGAEPELAVTGEEASSAPEPEAALVPAEPLPPASPAPAKTDVPVVAESVPVPPQSAAVSAIAVPEAAPVEQPEKAVSPASPASVAAPAPVASAPAPIAPVAVPAPAQNASNVPVVSSLTKGGYYVQIGSYADMSNVNKIVDKYGSKYPFTVEKGATKKGDTLKVYVGPVKKDEYGAVLERFRQLGFKDAFVKKVP
jgi:hypothetical protein